jgi:hypothetical protein
LVLKSAFEWVDLCRYSMGINGDEGMVAATVEVAGLAHD